MVSSAPDGADTRDGPATERAGEPATGVHRWLRGHVPGEPGIWFFVLGDMIVFAVFFAVFLVGRMRDPVLFAESRAELSTALGMANTVVLLTSSLFVAWAVHAFREGRRVRAGRLLVGAIGCGVLFLLAKVVEYGTKLADGIAPTTNDFFMYYFVFTGIHAAHVVLGIGGLVAMLVVVRRARVRRHDQRTLEIGASFWHMVDFLWIVLFPLFYLTS